MSYEDYDLSIHGAAPIECFKFIGELSMYRYTNDNQVVTVNGEDYIPLSGIERGGIETSSVLDSNATMDIKIPITCDIALLYNFLKMPLSLYVEVRSVHRGSDYDTEWKLVWQGQAISFPVSDNDATISTQSVIQSNLGKQLNQPVFQTPCNHEVYDEHCTLDPADFTTTSVIENIKDNVLRVGDTGRADGELAIGRMVNTRTGESRIIISNVGKIVTVGYPFIDIVIGDTIDMVLGCDNSYTMCLTRFNNVLNFGAFMFMPSTNPYVNVI